MNKAMVTIGIILMAIIGIFAINLITSQQTGQELDYYLLKDTTEAAMLDSISASHSFDGRTGVSRMDKERFVESFIRRFADSVDATRDYTISFYDINETPPKVSVKITSKSNYLNQDEATDINTSVDMIIESTYQNDVFTTNLNDKNNSTSTKKYTKELQKKGK